jgi:hypothetical protein
MIVKFVIVRKDTKAAIQGAKIVLEHGESDGLTNSAGEAEIIIFWSGNMMYSVEAPGYSKVSGTVQVPGSGSITFKVEMGALAAPSVPAPEGERVIQTVGQSCDILEKYMFGQAWYRHRNRYTGGGSSWDSELYDARQRAYKDASCNNPPPPPPKTVNDVQIDVDILRGTLQGIQARVQDLVTTITEMIKALTSDIARLRYDTEQQFLSFASKMNEIERKVNNITFPSFDIVLQPVYTAIDTMKKWIEDSIFDILLKNLDTGTQEWRKKQI